jgi:predicted nucleotidyltransferase
MKPNSIRNEDSPYTQVLNVYYYLKVNLVWVAGLLESIIKDERYLNDLRRYLSNVLEDGNVVGVLLFGSISKGMAKPYPESDIDLLIVARELPSNIVERRFMALKFKREPMAVEDIWLTPRELLDGIEGGWGLILDAISDGIIIYDPEGMLRNAKEIVNKKYRRMGRIWLLKKLC